MREQDAPIGPASLTSIPCIFCTKQNVPPETDGRHVLLYVVNKNVICGFFSHE